MGFDPVGGRSVLAVLFALGFMAAVTGCKSDDAADVLQPETDGGTQAPEDGKILQSELRAYCPAVSLRDGTAFLNSYEKNAQDDPAKLIYQASLATVTRKCSYAAGTMTLEVAAAGRVVPGPMAADGPVKLPIRVEAKRGDEVVYSNVVDYEVALSRSGGATQFIFNDANVSMPTPEPGSIQVQVGYVVPEKKKSDDEL